MKVSLAAWRQQQLKKLEACGQSLLGIETILTNQLLNQLAMNDGVLTSVNDVATVQGVKEGHAVSLFEIVVACLGPFQECDPVEPQRRKPPADTKPLQNISNNY